MARVSEGANNMRPLSLGHKRKRSGNLKFKKGFFDFDTCFQNFLMVFNSRKGIAETISGLLFGFLKLCCKDFCYDHMTSQSLQICVLFIRSCNYN